MQRVLILGGYGNFGKRIARALVKSEVPVIIAGRNEQKARKLKDEIASDLVDIAYFDAFNGLDAQLKRLNPAVVINTCGPFQASDYSIAESCITNGVHYIDLADGREFVTGIKKFDEKAKENNLSVISGASTVPGLSSAVLEHFASDFSIIDSMKFGISPGQKAERGLATTKGIFTYVGKALKPFGNNKNDIYGWQDIYRQEYPEIGKRWMANCDIPDLDLLPERYNIKSIRFSAGLELGFLHLGLWAISWLVRLGVPLNLPQMAEVMLKISNMFDVMGSADGGMHVIISGKDIDGKNLARKWFVVAFDGFGPYIPTIPAVILARKLIFKEALPSGAMACVGMVSLEEYLKELKQYPINTYSE